MSRGMRLRILRKDFAGKNMGEFAKICGVARGTVNNWEKGKNREGLTKSGAKRVVLGLRGMREKRIRCSELWLLEGIGDPPEFINIGQYSGHGYHVDKGIAQSVGEAPLNYGGSDLEEEIDLFKKNYPEHLLDRIQDRAMWPVYRKGDWVGGIQLPKEAIGLVHGMDCIVRLSEGKTMVRRVKVESLDTSKLSLYGMNAEVSVEYPPLRHIPISEVVSLAPVLRVWRKRFKIELK